MELRNWINVFQEPDLIDVSMPHASGHWLSLSAILETPHTGKEVKMPKMEWPRAGSYDLEVIRPREIRKIADFELERSQNSEVTGNYFRDCVPRWLLRRDSPT